MTHDKTRPSALGWLLLLLASGILALVYQSALTQLFLHDWNRQDFDYCFLIPVVIAYLIWDERQRFFNLPSRPSFRGLIAVALGMFLLLFGELGGEYLIQYISLWLTIFGLCWTVFGWYRFRVIAFPICFMLTAFPPPNFLYAKLTLGMQLLSSRIGVKLLHLLDISAYRSGNVIDLGFTQMEVVNACSGLRFLIPMIIVAILMVYLFKIKWWKRILVLLSAIPLAVVFNGARIGLIGYLAKIIDPSITEGPIHDITGWIMFGLGTGIMFGLLHLLGRNEPDRSGTSQESTRSDRPTGSRSRLLFSFLLALMLITATHLFLQYRANTEPVIPAIKELETFPTRLGEWQGRHFDLPSNIVATLDLSDYLQMSFTRPGVPPVDFYVAWYETQAKGESIHSPETCLRGGGWQFVAEGETEITIPGSAGSPLRVKRSVLQQGEQQMLSYFWFPCRGRNLVNAYELKIFTFWDSLTQRRTDGALVRVMTPIAPEENLAVAENRVQDFLGEALPVLEGYLPE